MFHPGVVILGI